jgi:hypothetical protein
MKGLRNRLMHHLSGTSRVIQSYVSNHPPDEVVPVAATNPGGTALDCAKLAPVEVSPRSP